MNPNLIFRWDVHMPKIVEGSIAILSDAGLGMAMFSLGYYYYSNSLDQNVVFILKGAELIGSVYGPLYGCKLILIWFWFIINRSVHGPSA